MSKQSTITVKHKAGGSCEVDGCENPHYGRGLCKKHHQWQWKRGLLPIQEVTLKEKVEMFSAPIPEAGCWIWEKNKNNKGYGRISIGGGKSDYAHRISYSEFNGEIPAGMEVCHRCDTPACVNPDHLFLGTHKENMADAARKGRSRNNPKYGVAHHNAFFDMANLKYILESDEPSRRIAKRLGCNRNTVIRARKGHTYKPDMALISGECA